MYLVTGGTGFLGRALVRVLLEQTDAKLRLLARDPKRAAGLDPARVEVVQGDLREDGSLDGVLRDVDCVFHLAAAMGGTWDDFHRTTVLGTGRLAAAALAAGGCRFIHVSSLWVAEQYDNRDVVDELAPYRSQFLNNYIRSKIQAEEAVRRAVDAGLDAVIVRPGRLFGPDCPAPIEPGYRLGRRWVVVGWNDSAMPTVYVDHAASAILTVARRGVRGEIYHVVDDEPVYRFRYLELLRRHGRPLHVCRVPYPVVDAVSRVTGCIGRAHPALADIHRRASMSLERLQSARTIHYSNARLKALGWSQPNTTESTLTQTICSDIAGTPA